MAKKKAPSFGSRLRKASGRMKKAGHHLHKVGTQNSSKRLKRR